MRNRARGAGLLLMFFGVSIAVAESGGPIASITGAPSEGLCTDCHGDRPLNSGGSVTLLNAPPYYKGGSTYTMTARVASTNTSGLTDRSWGFQLTAIDQGGAGIGTFATVAGQGTKIVSGEGAIASRRYVEQDGAGNRTGVATPADWSFRWTAPPTGSGPVTFHLVGMAANGDGSEGGDWVYHGSIAMDDSSTAVVPTSWGAVKHTYRVPPQR